jgi:PAS domain S-box-containing protein
MAEPTGDRPASVTGPAGQALPAEPVSQHAIIDMTRTGIVSGWNAAAAVLYGYLAEEIVGRAADVLCPEPGRAAEARILRQLIADGRTERHEADRVRKDGTLITVSVTAAPIVSPAGVIVGATTVSWEASDQQNAMRQAEAGRDGDRRAARNAQELFDVRIDSERSAARDAQELFDVRIDSERSAARDAQEQFDVQVDIDRGVARDARERFEAKVDSERSAARDAQEQIDAEAGSHRRESLAAQEQAGGTDRGHSAARERFEAMVDSDRSAARDAQDLLDAGTGHDRRAVRDAQERFEAKVGLERRNARDAQDRVDARIDAERRDARAAQQRFDVQVGIERRDAREAQERFDVRRDAERYEALEDNERLQAQLRQVQRLDSLGQLAGGVAHDFNNLLAVILNYASFVSQRLAVAAESDGAESWDAARSDVEQIRRATERGASLTRQLLAFASRDVIRPLVLDLNDVVADVEELLPRAIGEHIELVTSLADDLWPILADAGKLEQVLVNLAVNARDAMPAGGRLTIATENITLGADSTARGRHTEPGRHVRLQVSDTGVGMAPDVVERAFEPFFTTKSDSGGTGLGLATVYGILAHAEADIQISSRPGVGTTFTVVLPVTDEIGADLLPARETVAGVRESAGETVLVVEDEEDLRAVTERIFVSGGYRVLAAANGPEALDLARSHPGEIRLLVTDVVMPNMLGKEVAEKVRVLQPGIEVLYVSGYAQPVLASQGRLDPDAVLMEKPFSGADLLARAGQLLSSRTARRG